MFKRLIVHCTVAALLGACGSAPKLGMPDGRSRTAVNSQAAIDDYTTRTAEELGGARRQSQMSRQLDTVKRDLAELKAYMSALARSQEEASQQEASAVRPPASVADASVAKSARVEYVPGKVGEKIKFRDKSIVFILAHDVGRSAFNPSTSLERKLLGAAREGNQIEIRGGSDGKTATPANQQVAKARAENARQYLLKKGVEPEKMRTTFYAAGGFVADNSTLQGKAQNRRVEIEVKGLDTTAYQTVNNLKVGESK